MSLRGDEVEFYIVCFVIVQCQVDYIGCFIVYLLWVKWFIVVKLDNLVSVYVDDWVYKFLNWMSFLCILMICFCLFDELVVIVVVDVEEVWEVDVLIGDYF